MDIRKADSKGRVTGFSPGMLYVFNREKGYFAQVEIPEVKDRPEYTPADDIL